MAKKQPTNQYKVVIGCNVNCASDDPAGTRYEAGDTLGDVSVETLGDLVEMGAVEKAAVVEVKDGSGEDQ